jgi:glycosyltransferase involved in cell wall biosynthesis
MDKVLNIDLIGYVEFVSDGEFAQNGAIAGWAFDPSDKNPIKLRMFVDGWEVANTICESARPDVLMAGFGREHVGFRFEIPSIYCDGESHVVQLRLSDDDSVVVLKAGNSAKAEWNFTIQPEYPIARLDEWQGGDAFCWAIVVDRITGSKRPADYVIVRQSGRNIATLFPTMFRSDIGDHFECNPACGFILKSYQIEQLADSSPLHFYVHPDGAEFAGSPLILPEATDHLNPIDSKASGSPSSAEASLTEINSVHISSRSTQYKERYDSKQIFELEASGLFDQEYYLQMYPDIVQADVDPFSHFFQFGFQEGRKPNLYFDPKWYVIQNPDISVHGHQPLMHFLLIGESQGLSPCPFFDVNWYRTRYNIPPSENTLSHYLRHRYEVPLSPHPDFDGDFYAAKHPDVFAAKVDMFDHYFNYGYKELRNPSAEFDVKFYVQRYLGGDFSINPLVHYWAHRHEPGIYGRPSDQEVTVSREVKRFCRPGPNFEEFEGGSVNVKPQATLLAYYLPQFHAFAENDGWWGKGFTEWTNIVRGAPRFVGHYQPRVPRDLGFYTLESNDTMRRQIEMARASGVSGFVFYYYWFNGKRLMEGPVNRFLEDPTLDINFALMWANENWTRRWDGAESEVLISQDYRPGDDRAMAAEFAQHFKDPRYIRLQNRPLLMIYRPGIIPNVRQAILRWRELFRSEFQEDPLFVMAQAFNAEDPDEFGFDGAIEFPPHKLTTHMAPVNIDFKYLDEDFAGSIHRYDDVVAVSLAEPSPNFPLIKTAVPSWDNDARRQGTGLVITGSTPRKYESWLSKLVEIAKANPFFGEPIVCVNAWNEWCEGAYLEPDLHFGAAYLNATARAISGRARGSDVPRLVLVGHDAFPSGAQQLLLNIGRTLRFEYGLEFHFLLLDGGKLASEYSTQGPLSIVSDDVQLAARLRSLAETGFIGAIVNTTAAARTVDFLLAAEIQPVLLVHELPRILREKNLLDQARQGIANAPKVVFSAPFVRDAVLRELDVDRDDRTLILSQGSYKEVQFDPIGRQQVRQEFGLDDAGHLIIGVGYADLRKGFDLFLQIWRLLQNAGSSGRICLVWVGGIDPGLADWLKQEIDTAEATGLFKMAGYRDDMAALFSAASAFALTSREDPLPTVVLESLGAGTPVVVFDQTGGIPGLLREIGEGVVVPYGDTSAMANALLALLAAGTTQTDRDRRHALIARHFNFSTYVRSLVNLALPNLADISVAVPNYNYAQYMPARLGSIFHQTYPVREILVLDDCSRDDSLLVIPQIAREAGRKIHLIPNQTNSGSVFIQWRRAATLAQGEFVWIAEADDLSDPDFLARTTALLSTDPNIKLAFSDSRTIHADGTPQWDSYKPYYGTIEPGALTQTRIFDAQDFVTRFLAVKNLILNVSAVVWRRDALLQALDLCGTDLFSFRMAGDWLLYLTALAAPGARIGYESKPLNIHRRHAESVTHALAADLHLAEIARCHDFAAKIFELPDTVHARQQQYLGEVAKQLGTVPPGAEPPGAAPPGAAPAGKAPLAAEPNQPYHSAAAE